MDDWKLGFVLLINTAASVAGSSALKFAVLSGNPFYATIGGVCWAVSAATFLLLVKGQDLGVIAIVTQALSLLVVNTIGILAFGEVLTLKKALGLFFVLVGLFLIAWPIASK